MWSKKDIDKQLQEAMEREKLREPIYRGCFNKTCFCTGKCREIIGYRDKQNRNVVML